MAVLALPRDGAGAHGRRAARDGAPAGSGTGSDAGPGADTGTGSCQHVTQAFCAHSWPRFSPVHSSGMSGLIYICCIMSYALLPLYVSATVLSPLFVGKIGNTYSNVVYFVSLRVFFSYLRKKYALENLLRLCSD